MLTRPPANLVVVPAFELPEAYHREAVAELRRAHDHHRQLGRPPGWHLAVALALQGQLPHVAASGHVAGLRIDLRPLWDQRQVHASGSARTVRRKVARAEPPVLAPTDRPSTVVVKVRGRLLVMETEPHA